MTGHSSAPASDRLAYVLRGLGVAALLVLAAIGGEHAHAQSHLLMTTLKGEDSSAPPRGAPDHVSFQVVNPTRTPARVTLDSLVLYGPDGTTRLSVASVLANNHPARTTLMVPGHATVHIMIFFTGVPTARVSEDRFVARLTARIDGTSQHADSVITRPRRRDPR